MENGFLAGRIGPKGHKRSPDLTSLSGRPPHQPAGLDDVTSGDPSMVFHCRRLLPLMNSREYIRKSLKPSDSEELVNDLCEMHKPVMSDHIVIPEFHEPLSSVKLFNKVFPLPPKLFWQWKNGVTIKCQTRSVIHEKAWFYTEYEIASRQALLKANIIEHASRS